MEQFCTVVKFHGGVRKHSLMQQNKYLKLFITVSNFWRKMYITLILCSVFDLIVNDFENS